MEECASKDKANIESTNVLLFAYFLFGLNNFMRLQRIITRLFAVKVLAFILSHIQIMALP